MKMGGWLPLNSVLNIEPDLKIGASTILTIAPANLRFKISLRGNGYWLKAKGV